MKLGTDAMVQQSSEYLFSLLLVSVQTPLVYEGPPPAFDAVSTRKNGERNMSEKGKDVLTFCASCCNRLQQVSFFCPLSPISPSALPHTHTHSPVAQAGHRTSSLPVGPGTGISAGAAESQPPASSSSPPAPPSPSPPPADGYTPLVSVIHSGRREVGGV